MKFLYPSAVIRRRASEKGTHSEAFQSWRWVLLAAILLAVVTIGTFYFSSAQAQEANGAITGLTLTSDTPGTLTVSWDTASPAPTDYRVDWAKSTEEYQSWKVDEGHVYPAETAKTVTITDLAHDTEYKIRMRARYYKGEHENKSWGGPWAEESLQVAANTQQEPATPTPEPTPTPAPGALDEVNSTDDGSGGLVLSWQAPAAPHDQPADYRVNWAKSADEYPSYTQEDANAYPTNSTHTLEGLEYDTEYKIQIRARYYQGEHEDSPWSGPWRETTAQVQQPLPAAPNLTGTPLTPEGQVMLVWQDPSDDSITGYQILRGPDADSLAVIEEDTGSSATIYTDTSPPAGQTHTYAVKARNAAGLSPLSDTVTATMPPAAPTGLTALPTHDSLMLSWHTPDHDGITGYQVLRGPDADSLEVVATDTGSLAPWYVDTDVSEDTSYAYAVKALGAGGESAPSGVVEVSTLQAATITFVGPSVEEDPPIAQQQQEGDPPPSPYHLRLFASHDRVTLRWGSYGCCGNVTGFRILRGPSEDTLEVLVADTGSATPWYVDSAVEAGTGYVYAIKSLNGNGESPESTSRSVTTSSAPGANTLLSNMGAGVTGAPVGDAAFVGSGKAAQAFTTGDNAQGYNLEGVRVDVFRGNDAPIDPKVSLYATNGFRPSTPVYELTPPERDHTLPDTDTRHVRSHEYRRGSEYYTAPAGATLSANTRYLVVFEQGSATDQAYSSSYYTMGNITGEANSGAASGWSIGYSIHIDSGTQIFRTKRQIAIIGSAR